MKLLSNYLPQTPPSMARHSIGKPPLFLANNLAPRPTAHTQGRPHALTSSRQHERAARRTDSSVVEDFFKGSVTTGLLLLFQNRNRSSRLTMDSTQTRVSGHQAIARMTLQAGVALAAGTAAARALRQSRPGVALLSAAAGATAILATERWLTNRSNPIKSAITKNDAVLLIEAPDGSDPNLPQPPSIQMEHTLPSGN